MDAQTLIVALLLITLTFVAGFAIVSKTRTEQKLHSNNDRKSSLAADGDPHKRAD